MLRRADWSKATTSYKGYQAGMVGIAFEAELLGRDENADALLVFDMARVVLDESALGGRTESDG